MFSIVRHVSWAPGGVYVKFVRGDKVEDGGMELWQGLRGGKGTIFVTIKAVRVTTESNSDFRARR